MLHEIIHAEVPILIMNGERIEKNGWIINRQTSQIEVEGEVEKIPQHISIDASKLKLGDVSPKEEPNPSNLFAKIGAFGDGPGPQF